MSSTPSPITPSRTAYPSDVTDEEWAFVVPYLVLLAEDAGQRRSARREVVTGLRYSVKTGAHWRIGALAHWRLMPHDLPPWQVVYQQPKVSAQVGGGELRDRAADGRPARPAAPGEGPRPAADGGDRGQSHAANAKHAGERGGAARRGTGRGGAGYDGHQRRTGSKVHAAVETVGWAISWRCTARPAAGPMNRTAPLAAQLQDVPGEHVELASGDQGYPGEQPALEAAAHGLPLEVVTLPAGAGPTRGCVLLLPRHAAALGGGGGGRARRRWAARFRCLAHDDERLPTVLAGVHFVVFACLMLTQFTQLVHLLSSP